MLTNYLPREKHNFDIMNIINVYKTVIQSKSLNQDIY